MASAQGHGRKLRKVEEAEPSASASRASAQMNPEESSAVLEFKGILTGLNPKTDMSKLPEDIYNAEANLSVEYLFGSLDGAPLVDVILEWFTDTTLENLEWYFTAGDGAPCRSIQRHPLSRNIQEKTVQLYKRRVAAEGLSQRVAGEAVMIWATKERQLPLQALAFNHRAEAFYRADIDHGNTNPQVIAVREKGLRRIPVLHPGTSERICKKLIQLMNQYHGGSGDSFVDYLEEALSLQAVWKAHATTSRITCHNPKYPQLQQQFILAAARSADFNGYFKCWEHIKDCLSLANTLNRLGIKEAFEEWCNNNVEFLEAMVPQKIVTMMHNLTLLIMGHMRKYYPKSLQSIVVLEALKFTVPVSSTDGGKDFGGPDDGDLASKYRWVFKDGNAETTRLMNLINLPMINSAAVKRMTSKAKEKSEKGPGEIRASLKKRIRAEFMQALNPDGGEEVDASNPNTEEKAPRNKTLQKELAFKGYDDREKKAYDLQVIAFNGEESRPVTALDEVLLALKFVCEIIDKEGDDGCSSQPKATPTPAPASGPQKRKKKADKGDDEHDEEDAAAAEKEKAFEALVQKYHAPLSCCIHIWLTFAFTGQTILNCKIHKAYSLLRSELQSVLLKAFEKLQVDASDLTGGPDSATSLADSVADKSSSAAAKRKANKKNQNGPNGQGGPASVPALKLAEILCSTFSGSQAAGLPVAVESEDDEDAAFNRILLVMAKSKTSLVTPLCNFIHSTLHLPLALHTVPTRILSELAEVANGAEIRTSFAKMASQKLDLTDVFSIMKKHLEESFPFTWAMFGMDVLELYSARGFFPEHTQEVFPSTAHLQALLCLRSRYVLMVLMEAKTSLEEWGIDVPENVVPLLESLSWVSKMFPTTTTGATWAGTSTSRDQEAGKMKMNALVSLITSFDTLQPPSSWVQSWVSLLTSSSDTDSLIPWLQEQTGTSGEDLGMKSKAESQAPSRLSIAKKQVEVEQVREKPEEKPVKSAEVNLNLDKPRDLKEGQEGDGMQHRDDAPAVPASSFPERGEQPGEQALQAMDLGFNSNSPTNGDSKLKAEKVEGAERSQPEPSAPEVPNHLNQPAEENKAGEEKAEQEDAKALDSEASEECPGFDGDGEEMEASKSQIPSMVGADRVNSFSMPTDGAPVFQLSAQAKTLGLHAAAFTAQGVKSLELHVAAVMWKAFNTVSFQADHVLVDFMAADSRSRVQIRRPVPENMKLPFGGSITQNPQVVKEGAKGGTGFKVCCLFGINFYVASMSNDVMTHEVCVPAWSARSVNKSDQAFFEQKVGVHSIMMHIPEHIRRPTLLDVQLTFISCSMGAKERDALGNQLCPSGRFCFADFYVNYLAPLPNIEDNLEQQNTRHREKAEKMAKSLIRQNMRKQEKDQKEKEKADKSAKKKKQTKKATSKKRKAADGSESSDSAAEADAAEAARHVLEMAEEQQSKIDSVLREHMAKIKVPDYIPLTRLTSVSEKQSRSSRGLLMQQALLKARSLEETSKSNKSDFEIQMGIKACAASYAQQCEEDGIEIRNQKKVKGKRGSAAAKDDREMATQEVMKLGKHLLK